MTGEEKDRELRTYLAADAEEWGLHGAPHQDWTEQGRRLASQRDNLIASGADPSALLVPAGPPLHEPTDRDIRRETFAEVSAALNRVADMWEQDGSDPCRVRISREYANAYRACDDPETYARGYNAGYADAHPYADNVPSPVRALGNAMVRAEKAEAEVGELRERFPCDGLCSDYPEEDCSLHGRKPADLWGMLSDLDATIARVESLAWKWDAEADAHMEERPSAARVHLLDSQELFAALRGPDPTEETP